MPRRGRLLPAKNSWVFSECLSHLSDTNPGRVTRRSRRMAATPSAPHEMSEPDRCLTPRHCPTRFGWLLTRSPPTSEPFFESSAPTRKAPAFARREARKESHVLSRQLFLLRKGHLGRLWCSRRASDGERPSAFPLHLSRQDRKRFQRVPEEASTLVSIGSDLRKAGVHQNFS